MNTKTVQVETHFPSLTHPLVNSQLLKVTTIKAFLSIRLISSLKAKPSLFQNPAPLVICALHLILLVFLSHAL